MEPTSFDSFSLPGSIDMVNHPAYYVGSGKIETIDFIESHELNFSLGNVVKYVARAGKKATCSKIEDLEKAKWYLDHELNRVKSSEI